MLNLSEHLLWVCLGIMAILHLVQHFHVVWLNARYESYKKESNQQGNRMVQAVRNTVRQIEETVDRGLKNL